MKRNTLSMTKTLISYWCDKAEYQEKANVLPYLRD